jgi:hypothetical protein
MKTKAWTLSAVCFAFLIGSTCAATVFRISVEGGPDVLTATPPVERGSVLLVRLSDGRLTSIPSELVRSVSAVPKSDSVSLTAIGTGKLTSRLASAKAATALGTARTTLAKAKTSTGMDSGSATPAAATLASGPAAGTTIILGPTGGSARTSATDTVVISATRGSSTRAIGANGLGNSAEAQIFRGDLPRLTPMGTALTLAAPATPAAASPLTEIGPNGFPVFAGQTAPALASVGPNGFLTSVVPATAAATPAIAPNGFPATAAAATAATAPTGLIPVAQAPTAAVPTSATAGTVTAGGASTSVSAPSGASRAAGTAATASPQ